MVAHDWKFNFLIFMWGAIIGLSAHKLLLIWIHLPPQTGLFFLYDIFAGIVVAITFLVLFIAMARAWFSVRTFIDAKH